jgi:NAD(P)H-hydrate repair Nnr-like enzyme with NAD(P)H-hydrate epimerase domain
VRGTLLGIEERGWVSGEREEDFVEHGSGDNGGAAVVGACFLRLRTVRRWTKTMSKLNSSKRHIEGRVALRTSLA